MHQLGNRVAVITGAASGIGFALAQAMAGQGMRLVLSDIEPSALQWARDQLVQQGATVAVQVTDVGDAAQVQALADLAYERFGAVNVLCNNAGVAASSHFLPVWEVPLADWAWMLSVNLMGVVHGLRAFVPRMLAGGEEGHIVNTASTAGLLAGSGPYSASKQGVVCLTEGLFHDLRARQAKLSASVLCPGYIRTAIAGAERNRPEGGAAATSAALTDEVKLATDAMSAALQAGFAPSVVADAVIDAIRCDRFYVVPAQAQILHRIHTRMHDIVEQRNPTMR